MYSNNNTDELPVDTRWIKNDNLRFALAGLALGVMAFLFMRMVEGVM